MCAPLFLLGLFAVSGFAARADITLSLNFKDGDKVSDITKLIAKVESSDGIDKVEFRVDDDLRNSDTSVPYEYEWDTIADTEGAHTISITAYDSNMQTKRITVALAIDNEIALGAPALAQKAQDALAAKDNATALRYSRRALKAEPGNSEASRVLAGLYAGQQDLPKAIATLEKAKNLDASTGAMLDLAAYRLRRALQPENAATFLTELQAVNDLRHKAADLAVKETTKRVTVDGKISAEGHDAIGDALTFAGHTHQATLEYGKAAIGDDAPLTSVNRLALSLVMENRPQEAMNLLRPLMRTKKADAVSRAIEGLSLLRQQQFVEARAAVQPDLADHVPASLIVAAYADSALGKRRDAAAAAHDAAVLLPNVGEAQFALAIATPDPVESDSAISRALALSPFQVGLYLEYAARIALSKRQDRYDQALNLTDLVLKAEPDNMSAKMMQAMIFLQANRLPEAEPILKDLNKKYATEPDMLLALATYWNVKDSGGQVTYFMNQARKADADRFAPSSPLRPLEFIALVNRKLHYRGGLFLTPASLYPATTP